MRVHFPPELQQIVSVSSGSFLFVVLIPSLKPKLSKLLFRILIHEMSYTLLNIQAHLTKKPHGNRTKRKKKEEKLDGKVEWKGGREGGKEGRKEGRRKSRQKGRKIGMQEAGLL